MLDAQRVRHYIRFVSKGVEQMQVNNCAKFYESGMKVLCVMEGLTLNSSLKGCWKMFIDDDFKRKAGIGTPSECATLELSNYESDLLWEVDKEINSYLEKNPASLATKLSKYIRDTLFLYVNDPS